MDDALHAKICELCQRGDELADLRRFEEAFSAYRSALEIVPEPAEDWEATTWILAAIGDLYFTAGNTEKSLGAFEDAVRCPTGLGNPFIHLRIGQCHFDLGHDEVAADEVVRAYMGGGRDIFEDEDPKYLQVIEKRIGPI